jgi:uncharacterized protein YxeA
MKKIVIVIIALLIIVGLFLYFNRSGDNYEAQLPVDQVENVEENQKPLCEENKECKEECQDTAPCHGYEHCGQCTEEELDE